MSGMPFLEALLLLVAVVVLVIATRRRLHPFLAIVGIGAAFGWAAGFSTGFLGKAFGAGFSQAAYSPGLVVVAAGLVAALADATGATERLAGVIKDRHGFGGTGLAAALGLIAGLGAVPSSAFAVLTPLLPAIGGAVARTRATLALALSISASHGLLLIAPVPVAAAAILGAAWSRVILFGLPVTLLLVVFAAAWAGRLPPAKAGDPPLINETGPPAEKPAPGAIVALLLATTLPMLMLIVQSLGDIPSEPFGGGPTREMILGFGRPLILFLVGLALMALGHWRLSARLAGDSAWTGQVLASVSGILLVVGAAGGLQRLCQETGMAELVGERLLGWPGGLAVPFVVAAAIKTLQGSSLVAAITTAGMVQPILTSLGLADENGKALAALAIGAGAMTVSHVNDEFFWLVADRLGLSPGRGLFSVTVAMVLQGLVAVAALMLLSVLMSRL